MATRVFTRVVFYYLNDTKVKKTILFIISICCCILYAHSQISVKAIAYKTSDSSYQITITATTEKDWHIYGEDVANGLDKPSVSFSNVVLINDSVVSSILKYNDPLFDNAGMNVYKPVFELTGEIQFNSAIPASLSGVFTCMAGKPGEFLPIEIPFTVSLEGGTHSTKPLKVSTIDIDKPKYGNNEHSASSSNVLTVFLLGFIGGLLSLLTPCVFPMIPVTISFFTTKSQSRKTAIRNGILYGLFIMTIYAAASLPFHFINGVKPELLNNIATSVPLNLVFCAIFIFFALSFFGLFEISLPSSLATAAGKKTGIFFMALTLAIVSFSCTGPVLGSLLVGAASGGAWLLTAGLLGFGIALALPFALFAIFPEALKSIPRSGEWMVTVKRVLAFVELALAIKFLSNADLVMHWGILKREVFIGLWLIITIMLIGYLINLSWLMDYGKWKVSKGRLITAVIATVFGIYLTTGLFGNNLTLLSGFPPPMRYSIRPPEKADKIEPDVINDYEKALAIAKKENKPLLIDFTGWACVNCRKMEENVWPDQEISSYIKDKFILVSLYVDDKKELPLAERSDSIRTIGDKWAKFQAINFGQASQPLYAVIDTAQRLLTTPVGYTPDKDEYLKWLKLNGGD